MAERRMFAKTIIDSDAFLDMPQSTQLLYFQLSMRADDDGFINNPKSIMRNVGCKDDDLKVLASKKFIIPFESGVIVIKHWRIHNYIQKDRYHETKYKLEKAQLSIDENGSYTQCIQAVSKVDTQARLELGKDSIDNTSPAKPSKDKYTATFNAFWEAYPRREGKGQAAKVYASKLKHGETPETIQARLAIYKAQIASAGTEYQFIRHPSTFLNNLDDYTEAAKPKPKDPECDYSPSLKPVTMTPEEREMYARTYERGDK